MILVDTSVWVDHLRSADRILIALLDAGRVLSHPFVVGEISLGMLARRKQVLEALSELPQTAVATDDEVRHFIEHSSLAGLGIGYVDAHLLAAARLTSGCQFWTRDKRLHAVAEKLGLTESV